MKPLYAKVLLYSQKSVQSMLNQIDQLVLNKAIASMGIFKSCETLCLEIINLTKKKDFYINLYSLTERAINRLNEKDRELIRYKYFYDELERAKSGIDAQSREYFRKQVALLSKIGQIFEYLGVDDKKFEKQYLSNHFIRKIYSQVLMNEIMRSRVSKREKKRRIKAEFYD